jgi:cobalt-zinc-cadmium efflux system protein
MSHASHHHDHAHSDSEKHDHDSDHSHGHSHGHASNHGHSHLGVTGTSRRLTWTLVAVLAFMALEAVTGWLFNSLALLSDSVHMLGDALSIGLAALAATLAKRRATVRRTYGYKRLEVLAAFANALSLLWLCAWLTYEAVLRCLHPMPVQGRGVLIVALAGLVVNVAMLIGLHRGEGGHSLNEQGVIWHIVGDTLSSVAAVIAGVVISLTGHSIVDPLLAMVVVAILLFGAIRLLVSSGHILVEGAPEGLDTTQVRSDLLAQPQVATVHDLHVWTMDGRDLYASAHVGTASGPLTERDIARNLTRLLSDRHHFDHITLQVGHCTDDACGAHCEPK